MGRIVPALGVVLVLLTMAPFLSAQTSTTGSIAGTVQDASGAVMADAKVTITSPALVIAQTALSSAQGTYRFPQLPPGVYTLTVEAAGFQMSKRENINIAAGFSATIDVPMALAGQAQTVAVTAEAPALDTENTQIQNTFEAATLRELPTARDMWSLIGVAPGLKLSTFDVGGSQTGTQIGYSSYGMSGQQRVNMDGVNMTEGNSATSAYTDYSAFEEVQMGTSGNDASASSPGVQINFVVKSGGNQFHGEFYQDYEDASFQGTNVSQSQLLRGAGTGTRITSYHDTNGDFGGPIKKDKLWFFTSIRSQYIGTTVTGYPVDNPGSLPFYTRLSNATYKLTYQLNSKNKISHMLNYERKQQPYRNASSTQYGDAVYNQDLGEWIGDLEWNSTISANANFNLRVGVWGYNWTNTAYPGPDGVIDLRRVDNATGDTAGGFNPQRYSRRRWQLEPTYSYAANHFLGTNHFFTFGFLTEKETYQFEQYPYKNAILETFNSPGLPDFSTPSQVTIYNTPAITTDYLRHNGAYAQDKVKLNKHLTLNLGIRWDYNNNWRPDESIRSDVSYAQFFYAGAALPNGYTIPASFPSLKIPGADNIVYYPHAFTARLGAAWDIFGDGKTSLKVSYGRYYENPGAAISNNVNPLRQLSYTFKWNDLNGDKIFQNSELGAFQSSTGTAASPIDPKLSQPYMDDFNGFVEHQIGNGFVVRGGFVYRMLKHDWALQELNRTTNLFTKIVNFTDPGPTGTSPGTIPVYDIPVATGGSLPVSSQEVVTPDSNNSYWKSVEFTAIKRMTSKWSMTATYLGTWGNTPNNFVPGSTITAAGPGGGSGVIPYQPNYSLYNEARTFNANFRLFATYNAKWGIVVSPVYRFQLGTPFAREVTVSGLNIGTITIPVDPVGTYRTDNISIFDTRVEKRFTFKERYQVGVFFDAFNINNSNAAQTEDPVTGTKSTVVNGVKYTYQRFEAPTLVVSPRIFRIGAKFSF